LRKGGKEGIEKQERGKQERGDKRMTRRAYETGGKGIQENGGKDIKVQKG
jgi:hypothetical protein